MTVRLPTLKFATFGLAIALLTGGANAGAFIGGTVIDVPSWDVLNIRAWPSPKSHIIDSYDNGDNVSLTGRCKNIVTGKSFSIDVAQSQSWKYKRMSAPRVWCQVLSPNTDKIGWVRGAFVFPQ